MGMRQDRGLTGMEVRRYRVIQDVIDRRLTQREAGEELELSVRQVRRVVRKVRDKGAAGVIHGLVGKRGNRFFDSKKEEKIIQLWKDKYRECGLNFTHFTEKLTEVEKIPVSKEKVRLLLREKELVDMKAKKGRKHRRQRPRRLHFGELIQQDTSPHDWLGIGKEIQAINAVDDATSRIVYLKLCEHDGTLPNMEAMRSVILRYGIPMSYYVDKASWFKVTRHLTTTISQQSSTEYETQIQRALEELGVGIIYADSPQAKGRVERSNGTLQNRLISELKLHGCKTIRDANRFIDEYFIDDYNRRFGVEPIEKDFAFVPLLNKEQLDRILCLRFTSTTQNDNTVSRSKYYKLQLLPTQLRTSWVKAPVEVSIRIDGSVEVRHRNTREVIPHEVLDLKVPTEIKHERVDRTVNELLTEKHCSRRYGSSH